MTDYLLVLTTCPDEACAQQLAHDLVKHRLAACVSRMAGITSVYPWQGQLHESKEIQLMIKTKASCYIQLEQAIIAIHPYQVPEIIALPIAQGLAQYLQWIDDNTSPILLA